MPKAETTDLTRTLAMLVDRTSDGVVVTDSGGSIVAANPAFLTLAGTRTEDELRGRPLGDWLGRIDTDVAALLAGAHEHGIAHLVRSSLRRAGADPVDVDVTAAMLTEGEQECFGFTLRGLEPQRAARAAWEQALRTLDESVGMLPLDELMTRSRTLLEQRFMAAALARTHGNAEAAASLLGIPVEKLLKALDAGCIAPSATQATAT